LNASGERNPGGDVTLCLGVSHGELEFLVLESRHHRIENTHESRLFEGAPLGPDLLILRPGYFDLLSWYQDDFLRMFTYYDVHLMSIVFGSRQAFGQTAPFYQTSNDGWKVSSSPAVALLATECNRTWF
jgi:hypothetical protein